MIDIPDTFATPESYSSAFLLHVAEEVRAQLQQALQDVESTRSYRVAITNLKGGQGDKTLNFSLHGSTPIPQSLLKPTDIALLSNQPLQSLHDSTRSTFMCALIVIQGMSQQGEGADYGSCRAAQMYVEPGSQLEHALKRWNGGERDSTVSMDVIDWVVTPLGSLATPGRVTTSLLAIASADENAHSSALLHQVMCNGSVLEQVPMHMRQFAESDLGQHGLIGTSNSLASNSATSVSEATAAARWCAATFNDCISNGLNRSQAMAVAVVSRSLASQQPDTGTRAGPTQRVQQRMAGPHTAAIHMIQGPPGTGKTSTIVRMLCVLTSHSRRVLMCAPTNVAVAEVANRLLRELDQQAVAAAAEGSIPCRHKSLQLADIFLVGSADRIDTDGALGDIFLDDRAKRVAEALNPYAGSWGPGLMSIRTFLCEGHQQWGSQDAADLKTNLFKPWAMERMTQMLSEMQRLRAIIQNDLPASVKNTAWLPAVQRAFRSVHALQDAMRALSEHTLKQLLTDTSLVTSSQQLTQQPPPAPGSAHHAAAAMLQAVMLTLQQLPPPLSLDCPGLPGSITIGTMKAWLLPLARVIFCTVSSSGSYALRAAVRDGGLVLDACIIDEAAQLVEAEASIVLAGFPRLRAMVLVGDHKQLPATVISQLAKEHGYGRSLFERLQVSFVLDSGREVGMGLCEAENSGALILTLLALSKALIRTCWVCKS